MSRQRRTLLALGLAEVVVAVLWVYLERLALTHPEQVAPEFHRALGSTLGSVMGFILGFGVLLLLIARSSDRRRK